MQALWTMARERLNVTVIVLANREYAILKHEYVRMAAATMGDRARSMLSLGDPDIQFARLAEGFGVQAVRAIDTRELARALEHALANDGPMLIEACMPPHEPTGLVLPSQLSL